MADNTNDSGLGQMGGEKVGSLQSQPYESLSQPDAGPSELPMTKGGPADNTNTPTSGLLDPDEAPYVTPGVTEFAPEAEDVKDVTPGK
jgi:hypothetical protein